MQDDTHSICTRRKALGLIGAAGVLALVPGHASAAAWIAPLSLVRQVRIAAGPLAGAFVVAPQGYVNWYFANLGLYPFVERMRAEVQAYLSLVLSRLDPATATIADVVPDYTRDPQAPDIGRLQPQDSDDAYAATLLALAARYDAVWHDDAWWLTHVPALKRVARRNILALQKPTGLTRTFQDITRPGAEVSYLMDNCEAFDGLSQFAARLQKRGDGDAARFALGARRIATGVAGLFDADAGRFRPSDADSATGSRFYPDATAQVFPQLCGVAGKGLGRTQYDAGWATLNRLAPDWSKATRDAYPWMVLGHVAALRGGSDARAAKLQMAAVRELYRKAPARVTINEIGYYARAAKALAGQTAG